MYPKHLTEEFLALIPVCQKIVVGFHHEYIHVDHLFLAMLRTPCLATPFIKDVDEEGWAKRIQENYPGNTDSSTPDNIPLTLELERIIVHADAFAYAREGKLTSTVDLLLAMLAYTNPIKEALTKKGLLLEGVMEEYYGPDAVWPSLPVETHNELPIEEWIIMDDEFKEEDIERLYGEALMLANYELYDEAVTICNAALDFNPNHPDFTSLLAYTLCAQKKYDLVDPLLEKLQQDPAYKSWCTQLSANIAGKLGDYELSIRKIEQQLVLDPGNASLLNGLGYYFSKTQQFAVAITHLNAALQIDPHMAAAHSNLGFSLYRTGQQEAGMKAIVHSLELDKGNAYAYKNLGIIYKETGDPVAAKEYFRLALKYKYTELYGDEVLQLLEQLN